MNDVPGWVIGLWIIGSMSGVAAMFILFIHAISLDNLRKNIRKIKEKLEMEE